MLGEGAEDSDKETYIKFLEYCEERRRSWAKQVEKDEARMKDCKRKEEQWESMKFLQKNDKGWQTRKIKEIERIKDEKRIERLTICAQKKKRYGLKKLTKESRRGQPRG